MFRCAHTTLYPFTRDTRPPAGAGEVMGVGACGASFLRCSPEQVSSRAPMSLSPSGPSCWDHPVPQTPRLTFSKLAQMSLPWQLSARAGQWQGTVTEQRGAPVLRHVHAQGAAHLLGAGPLCRPGMCSRDEDNMRVPGGPNPAREAWPCVGSCWPGAHALPPCAPASPGPRDEPF